MRKPLLATAYYLVVTPIGLVSRVIHDPLSRRWNRRTQSYWILTDTST
jgi:hypothetical protein